MTESTQVTVELHPVKTMLEQAQIAYEVVKAKDAERRAEREAAQQAKADKENAERAEKLQDRLRALGFDVTITADDLTTDGHPGDYVLTPGLRVSLSTYRQRLEKLDGIVGAQHFKLDSLADFGLAMVAVNAHNAEKEQEEQKEQEEIKRRAELEPIPPRPTLPPHTTELIVTLDTEKDHPGGVWFTMLQETITLQAFSITSEGRSPMSTFVIPGKQASEFAQALWNRGMFFVFDFHYTQGFVMVTLTGDHLLIGNDDHVLLIQLGSQGILRLRALVDLYARYLERLNDWIDTYADIDNETLPF